VKHKIPYIIVIIVFFLSCKKDNSKPSWDIDYIGPLAHTTMTISDIIKDSVLQINNDSTVSLVYKDSFYGMSIDTIFSIVDTSIEYTAKLSDLKINDIIESDRVSLGDIAQKDYDENGPGGSLYTAIMNGQNTGLPVNIDAIPPQTYSDINIDATDYFETMTLEYAVIDIEIDNQLPIPITNVVFELRNSVGGEIIINESYATIASGETVNSQKILTNFTIEGLMLGNVSLESPGGTSVIVDTSKAVTATINVHDIKIISALARFPNQDIIDLDDKLVLDINPMQLNFIETKEAYINVEVFNTLPEEIHFNYTMPEAKKNSVPLSFSGTVPAANGSTDGYYHNIIDLSGYDINFTGLAYDTVNTLNYTLSASIDSSGNLIPLSLNDSIYLKSKFYDVTPNFAEGWFGNDTIFETGISEIESIEELANAQIDFDEAKLTVTTENGIGVQGAVRFNNVKAINSNTGNQASLNIPSQYTPFDIDKATNTGSSAIPAINSMFLNATNSNTNEVVNVIPNSIEYDIDFYLNHNQSPPPLGTGTDFVYYGDEIKANIEIEIPLSLIASNLVLNDTVDLDIDNVNEIESGKFYLFAYNGFPLDADIQVYLLDDSLNIVDSLFNSNTIVYAANIDPTSNRVEETTKSKFAIPMDKERFDLFIRTKKLRIKSVFKTQPQSEHVQIYSDYTIEFKLTGDFSYHLGF
jgi:hypothetical protein